jgi:hypothetical protein
MWENNNPLSLKNLLAGVLIALVSGVILAWGIQDARFAPKANLPSSDNQSGIVIPSTPTVLVQHICGNVTVLEFLQDDLQIGTNSGRWRLALVTGAGSSACWYKITRAGILSGEKADHASGAGPFRAGIEPHVDFPCSDMGFDVWANVDGWDSSDWTMIGGPFLISPSFCE